MEFFAGDIERITGVQRIRLHHWMKEGFLTPSIQVAQGIGDKNIYSLEDVYRIALLKKLLESGIHGKTAATFLRWNFKELRTIHVKARAENKVMVLTVVRKFDNSILPETFISIQRSEPKLEDRVYEFFGSGYDNGIIINLSRLIEDVDLKA